MDYQILVYHEGGVWVAEAPELPGCAAHGNTEAEALACVESLIPKWIAAARQSGRKMKAKRCSRATSYVCLIAVCLSCGCATRPSAQSPVTAKSVQSPVIVESDEPVRAVHVPMTAFDDETVSVELGHESPDGKSWGGTRELSDLYGVYGFARVLFLLVH